MSMGFWSGLFYGVSALLMLLILVWPEPPKILVASTFTLCGFVGNLVLGENWWGLLAWGVGLVYFWFVLQENRKKTTGRQAVVTHKQKIETET